MVKLTGNVREFAKQRMHVGALVIDGGTDIFGKHNNGQNWYVDSAASANGDGRSPGNAFDTLDEAFAAVTANRGDIIYVMPNHAETITGVGGIAHDVAGIAVVGLGVGNQRPRFLMDGATTVTYLITADDAYVQNLVFASGHSDVVTCINVSAAKYTSLVDLEFTDNTTNENWLTPIKVTSTTNNDSDGLKVENCRWTSIDAGGLEFIEVNADIKAMAVRDNFVVHEGTASALVLFATGKDMQYGDIEGNFLSHKMTANELLVNIDTSANSGIIAHNRVGHADVTSTHDLGINGLGCRLFDNLSVSTDALSGVVLPAIDVNS